MEPESSLPSSQEPSTGPYPQPDQSSLYHPILSKISVDGKTWRLLVYSSEIRTLSLPVEWFFLS
jgi:hypothetical protein